MAKSKEELKDEKLDDINGGMKVVVIDDDPEELTWWEKFLKLFFKK